ncbi:MAG: hypothetical protein H6733_12670 [Alphaproteobacteria bacterium]|nr:hypothetical protein [Alphaproteobacteria bacterium]
MRPGQDRHTFADEIFALLFPDGAAVPRGIALGATMDSVSAREGQGTPGGGAWRYDFPVDDPHGHGRRVEVKVHVQVDRVTILTACVYSANKIDVDAPYRVIRDHLDACYGKPGKQVGSVLTFVYQVPGELPGVMSICRFKDAQQENVLEVTLRVADGVRITGVPGGKRPST